MKAFFIWLGIALSGFCTLFALTHIEKSAHPARILVALDTSYGMSLAREGLDRALESLKARYSHFAFVDSLTVLRGWEDSPLLASTPSFFGDSDYAALGESAQRRANELGATRIIFVVAKESPPELAGREVIVVR